MSEIGEKIKRLRRKKGLTQVALAKMSGLHRVGIARIETGQRKTPDLMTRKKLAEALGVDITVLLEEKMNRKAKEWNKEVEAKVNILKPLLQWLREIERHKKSTWEDVVSAGRARRQIEMAILDIYNLQYFSEEEARHWRESLEVYT